MRAKVIKLLQERGVTVEDIGALVYELQHRYNPDLTVEACARSVFEVLKKREVQNAFLTGIALDMLAERKLLPQPLQGIIERDEPLYGVDEIMALGITNIYGSIGLTNFGFLDRQKIGILMKLDQEEKKMNRVHTFLDDLIAGLAAAAAAKMAHRAKSRRSGAAKGAKAESSPRHAARRDHAGGNGKTRVAPVEVLAVELPPAAAHN